MNTEELDEIEARAEANARAFIRMDELNGGVGLLGVKEPEMLEDLARWDDSTDNDHADTVLVLVSEVKRLRESETGLQQQLKMIERCLAETVSERDDAEAERDALQGKLDKVRRFLGSPSAFQNLSHLGIHDILHILDASPEVES